MQYKLIQGDCIAVLKELDEESFDSVVTDPPYNLQFMGKDWDSFGKLGYQAWCEQWAAECLRVLKPGGFLLAFGGTRTYHRLACAIEDAGFEIRDSLHWIYGSGFPKSMDISKAIDKAAGAERVPSGAPTSLACEYVRRGEPCKGHGDGSEDCQSGSTIHALPTAPATEAAKTWEGWGTALKPAHEPIVVARKPLSEKTVIANVLKHGTGGINIDGCRIAGEVPTTTQGKSSKIYGGGKGFAPEGNQEFKPNDAGRWPPNVVLTHSPDCQPIGTHQVRTEDRSRPSRTPNAIYGGGKGTNLTASGTSPVSETATVETWDCADDCPVAEMDRQSGTLPGGNYPAKRGADKQREAYGTFSGQENLEPRHTESGGASRFFPCFKYNPKASKKERPVVDGIPGHPTVKPVALMKWLVRLVTPQGGYVLDPFAGTGTTAEACELEGFDCLLIERDSDSIKRIEKRMSKYAEEAA